MPSFVAVCHREILEGVVEITVFGPYSGKGEALRERDLLYETLKDAQWQIDVVELQGKVGYRNA